MSAIPAAAVVVMSLLALLHAAPSAAAPCEDLAALKLPDTTIEAQRVEAGDYAPPASLRLSGVAALPVSPASAGVPAGPAALRDLPAFCRVHGVISPVPGSRTGFELWLPQQGWNGRLLMLGNGGYSSTISFSMASQLKAGYATLGTDTGHTGDDPDFANGRPEAIVDWAHRAVHESVVKAKAVVTAFFGQPPRYAYFAGCSTGGHQGFMEAQRHPEDFIGILAGAPGHNRTHIKAGFLWLYMRNHAARDDTVQIIPTSKLPIITRAVLDRCRTNNGSVSGGLPTDDFLDDPRDCDFDPASIQCRSGDGPDCLSAPQVAALSSMYDGARNPRTGERIYFGWTKGSESSGRALPNLLGWNLYWADPNDPMRPARVSFWRYWAFGDPNWNWWTFDFDRDLKVADEKLAPVINAMNPDLERFSERGGKIIHYHGLADPVVPAMDSISYHERVVAQRQEEMERSGGPADQEEARRATASFYRLFLVPGMGHCRGGAGPDAFDALAALEHWVEDGIAPDRIVATKFVGEGAGRSVRFTRPLCPFPRQAQYKENADPNNADSFDCAAQERHRELPTLGPDYLR